MSRFKHYTRSLISGYAALGANMVFTLLSVPLAFKYLGKSGFALWVLSSQIAGYVAMIDLGMNASVSRILIDKKDHRADGSYGGAIKAGALVGLTQSAIILLVGLSCVWFLADWLRVPASDAREFFWLIVGQIIFTALTFASRSFGQVLFAWQRMDIQNYAQMAQLFVWLLALWLGFALGHGVFSMLWSSAVGWLCYTIFCAIACRRLGLWPKPGEWGKASRKEFRELFAYGADVFLLAFGSQLIMGSQVVLVSRVLGTEAAAVWSVMTKAFTLVNQLIVRIIGNAMPAFAEMTTRGETDRLWHRCRLLFITVTVAGAVSLVMFAVLNSPFVSVWLRGRVSWPPINDTLLAVWMMIMIQQCCFNSFIVCLKQVNELKYTYLIEGVVFITASVLALPRFGYTGMLVCSIVCTTLFTYANGFWRVVRMARNNHQPSLLPWHGPFARVLVVLVPLAIVMAWLGQNWSPLVRIVVMAPVLGMVGAALSLGFALPRELTQELVSKLPSPLQRVAAVMTRRSLRFSRQ
jgi:O-antigen/teichoic acid export membrane protein